MVRRPIRDPSRTVRVEIPLLPSSLCSWIEWGTDVLQELFPKKSCRSAKMCKGKSNHYCSFTAAFKMRRVAGRCRLPLFLCGRGVGCCASLHQNKWQRISPIVSLSGKQSYSVHTFDHFIAAVGEKSRCLRLKHQSLFVSFSAIRVCGCRRFFAAHPTSLVRA